MTLHGISHQKKACQNNSFGLCLRQENETGRENGYFNAHMNLMIIEMTETRCLILEELLNTIQSCDL